MIKSGMIALIGKPNVGKSSLLNSLIDKDVSIVTNKSETTRFPIIATFDTNEYQLVYIDTPGITFKADNKIEKEVTKEAYSQIEGVDLIYFLVDRPYDDSVKEVLNYIDSLKIPKFLVITKQDLLRKDKLIKIITSYDKYKFEEYVPISSLTKFNLDKLKQLSYKFCLNEYELYPKDYVSLELSTKIKEIIRKEVIENTYHEIPYAIYIEILSIIEENNKYKLTCDIVCNKQSQKGLVIGKQGQTINVIKKNSIINLRKLLNKKVELELFVKVDSNWKDKKSYDGTYL